MIATHWKSTETRPARARLVRARRTFEELVYANLSVHPDHLFSVLNLPLLVLKLLVEESSDARALRMSVAFPVSPTEETAAEFERALGLLRQRMTTVSFEEVGVWRQVIMRFHLACDPATVTQAWVTGAMESLVMTAHALGVPLARIALGDAPAEAVEPVLSEVWERA